MSELVASSDDASLLCSLDSEVDPDEHLKMVLWEETEVYIFCNPMNESHS